MIRALIDANIVYLTQGAPGEVWQARESIMQFAVPESVQSVILSRLDQLDFAAKQTLQSAAVIGRLFRPRVLGHMLGHSTALDSMLATLEARDFIYQERALPEVEYSFKHVLVQDAVYGTLHQAQRQQRHQQAAEALEQLYVDNLVEYYEPLAYHYERSAVEAKAIEYLLKAGEKARRAYLNDEAIQYFQKGLARLVTPPGDDRDAKNDVWQVKTLRQLAQVYLGIGNLDRAEAHFQQAIVLAHKVQLSPRVIARLYAQRLDTLFWQGRYAEMVCIGEEGLTLLGDDLCSVETALLTTSIGQGHEWLNLRNEALPYYDNVAEYLESLAYVEELRIPYMLLISAYGGFAKRTVEAEQWALALKRQAEAKHDLRALADMHVTLGPHVFGSCGDLQAALDHLQQSLQLARKIGDTKLENISLVRLVGELMRRGELEKAEAYVRLALEKAEIMGSMPLIRWSQIRLAGILLCRGTWQAAIEAMQSVLQIAQSTNDKTQEIVCLSMIARIYTLQRDKGAAWGHLEQVVRHLTVPEIKAEFLINSGIGSLMKRVSQIEAVCPASEIFQTNCQRLRFEEPTLVDNPFAQWYLTPIAADGGFQRPTFDMARENFYDLKFQMAEHGWIWENPLGDCSFTVRDTLEMYAANGRDLLWANISAPRLLRPIAGDFAIQTICLPISAAQPAIGGLLLWQDQMKYLRLDKGTLDPDEISFRGCLANQDVIIGRGCLPVDRAFLRLERRGKQMRALCSADGQQWFTAGEVEFPSTDDVQVGMHAIGEIDRWIYPGAYPHGTAIRFESFAVYRQHD